LQTVIEKLHGALLRVIDAVPVSVWLFFAALIASAVAWSVRGQFDQDRHIAVLEERQNNTSDRINDINRKLDWVIQAITPHQLPPP
jgi:hypothetical protein